MKDSSATKVVLPALLAFITVFTTLNLAFSSQKENPLLAKLLLMGNREVKLTTIGADGNLTIRYVGLTIVASVGCGVAVVEVMRRLKVRSKAPQQALQNLISEDNPSTSIQIERNVEAFLQLQHNAPKSAPNPSSELLHTECTCSGDECSLHSHSIELRQHYQNCWIKLPNLERRLFAIVSDGFYYRFVRLEKTQEQAANLATRLLHRNKQAVVTSANHGYAVWVWEPDAYPDLAM